MSIVKQANESIYSGNLLLVNAAHPFRGGKAEELVPIDAHAPSILLQREAASAFQQTLDAIFAHAFIVPVSGYRSVEEQRAIYEATLQKNGAEFTKKYVALPQHSEHHTGLAIDVALQNEDIDFICPHFPYEGICNKFRAAALDYGFIERYRKDKEHITAISQEPWHFRYVGAPHAGIIHEQGFCLEEYLSFIMTFRAQCPYRHKLADYTEAEIYYVPATGGETTIALNPARRHQISGNNIDGFIVTAWRASDEEG